LFSAEEQKKNKIEDLDLAEEDILIVELPKIKNKEKEWTLMPN
jgi:hypothetical protein